MRGWWGAALLFLWACSDEPRLDHRATDGGGLDPEEGSALAHFEVPHGTDADAFSRLPFPNDVRRLERGLDLLGFPNSGQGAGRNVVGAVVRAAAEDLDGFGTNPIVTFSFSEPIDGESVEGRIAFLDVDPSSPRYGEWHAHESLTLDAAASRYFDTPWLAVRPEIGSPLRSSTTYAVVLFRGITTAEGRPFRPAADFRVLLENEAPRDPTLAAAHARYAPLRSFLVDRDLSREDLVSATVFRTQNETAIVRNLRSVVRAFPPPRITDVMRCGPGARSPCDGLECGGDPRVVELRGRIDLPIFQRGSPPYARPADGGEIALDSQGRPERTRTEAVCFSLTLPRRSVNDVPVVIYAHGTGGSHRSGRALATALAATSGEEGPPIATIAFDLPQHETRRGDSPLPPEVLFFNVDNPRAARDNVLQGAADLFALVHAIASGGFDAHLIAIGPIRLDRQRIALFGHSQGATHASLVLPYETELTAAVLSGNGGDLRLSLLHKTAPLNVSALLPSLLGDGDARRGLPGGSFHPALGIVQTFFERADPVNFARELRERVENGTAPHVFMTFGIGDSYSPESTMRAFARAAGFPVVEPALTDDGLDRVAAPLLGNSVGHGRRITHGMRHYAPPAGSDGHFVASTSGEGDVLHFLRRALAGELPAIGR